MDGISRCAPSVSQAPACSSRGPHPVCPFDDEYPHHERPPPRCRRWSDRSQGLSGKDSRDRNGANISWQRPGESLAFPAGFARRSSPSGHFFRLDECPVPLAPCGGVFRVNSFIELEPLVLVEVRGASLVAPFLQASGAGFTWCFYFCQISLFFPLKEAKITFH